MDHSSSWRPRPPIQGNNICPTCSISHFPFCPPRHENPTIFHPMQRPPFDPFLDQYRPPTPSNGLPDHRGWRRSPTEFYIVKKSKSFKNVTKGIDRISDLPDPLLSHIISLLPTQNAVATSVLSTRWKFLWTFIPNLEFRYDENCPRYFHSKENKNKHKMQMEKFARFVDRVLLLLNPPSVQDFRLLCSDKCFDHSYLNSWISAGFGRTLGEFDLSLKLAEPFKLLLSHIYCNVAFLKLSGDIQFNISAAASVCFQSLQALYLQGITCVIASNSFLSFPNLKIMHLRSVNFVNRDSVHKLFSSSPVLDDLIIEKEDEDEDEDSDDEEFLIIRIPSLKSLSIYFRTSHYYYYRTNKLQIDSPALQYLNIYDSLPCEYLPGENLSSLLQANVEILFSEHDYDKVETCISIIKFIGSLSKVEFLSVSAGVLKAIRTASANISQGFHNLTQLEIMVDDCLDLSVIIVNFLENMDNLEHLVMKGSRYKSCFHQSWWTAPLNVPKCLLSRITTIYCSCMTDSCCDQLELLRYFLKHAKVLQLLKIRTADTSAEKKLELLKKISLIPRRSQTCEVAFT